MKSSVAIALIICGTVLIALPSVHDTIAMQQLATVMVELDKTARLTGDMPKYADALCMFGGIAMVAVGAIAGLRGGKQG